MKVQRAAASVQIHLQFNHQPQQRRRRRGGREEGERKRRRERERRVREEGEEGGEERTTTTRRGGGKEGVFDSETKIEPAEEEMRSLQMNVGWRWGGGAAVRGVRTRRS